MTTTTSTAGRDGASLLGFLMLSVLITPFAAPWGDRPAAIREGEALGTRAAQWVSAWAWAFAFPFLSLLIFPPAIIATAPAGLFFLARRFAAARLVPLTIGDFAHGWRGLLRESRAASWLAPAGLAAAAVGPIAALIFGDPHGWAALAVALGWAVLVGCSIAVGVRHRRVIIAEAERLQGAELELGSKLAAAFGVSASAWAQEAGVTFYPDGSIDVNPVPPAAIFSVASGKAAQQLAVILPHLTIDAASGPAGIRIAPASSEELAMRAELAELGGAVAGIEEFEDGRQAWRLADTSGQAVARADAAARRRGLTVLEVRPFEGLAIVGQLSAIEMQLRDRFAGILKAAPWDLELTAEAASAGADHPIAAVSLTRMPGFGAAGAEKRLAVLRELVHATPGGSDAWGIEEDVIQGSAVLAWRQPRRLPEAVRLADVLPAAIRPDDWHHPVLGLDPEGQPVAIDLAATPHQLVVGPTGSGKSILMNALLAGMLARGGEIVIVDATKAALDFLPFRPYASAFATNLAEAQQVMETVRAEGERRKGLLQAYGAVKWSELPADVRREERVNPVLVVVDEFMASVIAEPVPKLDRDHPLVEAANERNGARAILLASVGSIARELRYAGLFLCVGTQRPDASQLPGFGEIRSNLTGGVQLIAPGKTPALETLRMIFPGDQTGEAASLAQMLDDGHSRGLALVGAEGGSVQGLRVAYAPAREIPEMLEAIGVQPAQQWRLVDPMTAQARPTSTLALPPVEVTVGEFSFSLDEITAEEDLPA